MKCIKFSDGEELFFDKNKSLSSNGIYNGEKHYHTLYEIYFLESGTCNYFADNKIYSMLPGDVAFVKANVIHNTVYGDEVCSRMLINCSHKFIPMGIVPANVYIYRNAAKTEILKDYFERIQYEYHRRGKNSEEFITLYIKLLLLTISDGDNEYNGETTRSEYINDAINFIKNGYMGEISLSETARKLSVSAEHLSRQFKKETGFGFLEYINILRLKKAEEMLLSGKRINITKIADACGFCDSNYFSVKFKNFYGVSPQKWRKKHLV